MKNPAFEKAYKRLNAKQKEAVDAIEGPVMVIAGPGTGKTTVLTLRIANILRVTDTPANGILALTFTESAVHSMRKKLVEYLGAQAYRVNISTFHGFAQEIITRYPEYFPRIVGGAVASESDRYAMLEEALDKGDFDLIRPFGKPTLYVRKALAVIQDLKRDTVDPKRLREILEQEEKQLKQSSEKQHVKGRLAGELKKEYVDAVRNNKKNMELAVWYAAYEKLLRERGMYDFEDMLMELVAALKKHKDLLRSLQEEYLYLLADEHQDANNAQNAVLELLSDYRDTRNLFIVGDEKQAIYRFQGASLENFLYFQKKFPDAKVVFLDENYRSTQTILDASHALMAGASADVSLRPRLVAALKQPDPARKIRLQSYETETDELAGIAQDISSAIHSGVPAEEIAILTRTNAEIVPFGAALAELSVPHTLFSEEDVLADPDIAKLLLLLQAVVSPHNDQLVGSMLLVDFLGINPIDAVRLNRTASERRRSPLELLSRRPARFELFDEKAVTTLAVGFVRWMQYAHNESAADALISIVREAKFQEYVLGKPDSLEKTEKLARLYEEVRMFMVAHKGAKLRDFIAALDTLKRHGSPLSFSKRSLGARGVVVMTAHKAKGLEWRQVYLAHVADKVWGNRRPVGGFRLPPPLSVAGESEQDEDERRLFYVALTRAKALAVLSFSGNDASGRSRLPSRFVEELPPAFVERQEGKKIGSGEHLTRTLRTRAVKEKSLWDRAYLREIFSEQGLNATALNNYLECPWKYFFRNLVRLPDVPEPYLHFGSAVHAALKAHTDAMREGKHFSENDFISVFELNLARLPLSNRDFGEALKKGKKLLPLYFAARAPYWHKEALAEYTINGVFLPLSSERNLLLRGRIDRVDLLTSSTVNVVDYKTGKYKTHNEILGKTKNSNGDIKRQLDFYRLLLEFHDKGKYEMVSAEVDFIEPDSRGKIRPPERFEMTHEDAERVSAEIRSVAEEIQSFSFWDKRCEDVTCQFCRLRNLL